MGQAIAVTGVASAAGAAAPEAGVVGAPSRSTPPAGATPGTVQSVSRALRLLEFVSSSRQGATAREIARHLDLALPSTYHLLATLTESGYLVHLLQDHRYGLGYRVRVLEQGLARQLEVGPAVAAAIRTLHVHADAAAYFAVYREIDVVVAHVVDSDRRPRVQVLDVGFHEATHATAFGKVMLAAMEDAQREHYLRRVGLRRCTSRTIVDADRLRAHLAHVRDSNVALEIGEFQDGLSCLASPVRSLAGAVVASVAISLPSAEFAARRWQVERAVRSGATAITRALNTEKRTTG